MNFGSFKRLSALPFALLFVMLLGMTGVVLHWYYGAFFHVKATRGVHSDEYYAENLRRSLEFDSTQGYSAVMLARYTLKQGDAERAMEFQREGVRTFASVRTFAQEALIHEFMDQPDEAKRLYLNALRMDPNNSDCLERLAILSANSGDGVGLRTYAERLLNLDMNAVNALYLLAKDMERSGDNAGALRNYVRISTVMSRIKNLNRPPIFKDEEISQLLARLVEVTRKP